MRPIICLSFALSLVGAVSCQRQSSQITSTEPTFIRGKTVYQAYCIACHNTDPRKAGAVGPEIWGSNQALIEARVLRGNYPEGYKPKRTTHNMPPLPQLKAEIEALEKFLNAP